MLTFDPPTLESQLRKSLLKVGDSVSLALNDGIELNANFDVANFPDTEICASTEAEIWLPRCENCPSITIGEAISLVDEVSDKETIFDGLIYHSKFRTLFRIASSDLQTIAFLEAIGEQHELEAKIVVEILGGSASVGLRSSSIHFASAVVLNDFFYDKNYPPIMPDDSFVEVTHPNGCILDSAEELIQAYMFELHSSLDFQLHASPRAMEWADFPEDEEISELTERARRIRPLIVGPGVYSVVREFNHGVASSNWESAFLSYVKCMEHVSATVVREKQYEDLRKRLLSREALNPKAEYLAGLLALFEENRVFTRDFEALRLTVERCCDPLSIATHAPTFLKAMKAISSTTKPPDRKQALGEFSAALSATRNQLAHAKANYELTGKECPPDEFDKLTKCAKLAAEQCIRWYAAHGPDLRR